MSDKTLKEILKEPCPKCGKVEYGLVIKLITSPNKFIKYVPQFQLRCQNCDKWIMHIAQTPEMVNRVNEHLEMFPLIPKVQK